MSNAFESPWWYRQVPRDFMSSPDVQLMTAEECGSFFFLLQWAWLGGDDCTLPNDPERLAKLARVNQVSKVVLDKFSVDKDGRLFNARLSLEWKEALKRSKDGKRNAQKRWEGSMPRHSSGTTAAQPAQSDGNATNTNTNTHTNTNTNKGKNNTKQGQVSGPSVPSEKVTGSLQNRPAETEPNDGASETPAVSESAQRLTQKLMSILERTDLKPATLTAWAEKADTLLAKGHTEQTVSDVMQWALVDSGNMFWRGRVYAMKNFSNCFKTILEQYQRERKGQSRGAAADPLAKRAASPQTGHDFSAMSKGDL